MTARYEALAPEPEARSTAELQVCPYCGKPSPGEHRMCLDCFLDHDRRVRESEWIAR